MARPLAVFLLLLATLAASGQSADLTVAATLGHSSSIRSSVTLALVNRGPEVARGTVLTIDVPAAITVSRASVGSGDVIKPCDTGVRPIRCELGDVHVGMLPHYGGIDFVAPIADAHYTVTISATSAVPDPNTANNAVTLAWETRAEADVNVFLKSETDRVDPGGSGRFVASICNETRENRVPLVRADFHLRNGVITSIRPATGFSCTVDGATAVCTGSVAQGCPREPFDIAVRASDDRRAGAAVLSIRATSDVPDPDATDNAPSAPLPIYRWLAVETTADAGPGSLREAIAEANATCTPGPCRIVFEIPGPVPPEGWFTITPSEPLPIITAQRVTLEGSRQTKLTGDTNPDGPEVAIDGRLAGEGLKLLSRCEAVVEGLAIGNFDRDQGLWIAAGDYCDGRPDRREVADNHIGVDPSGRVPWPNLRGLRGDLAMGLSVLRNIISHNRYSGVWMWSGAAVFHRNRIEGNGASGIFLGPQVVASTITDNRINGHPHMGVAVAARDANVVRIRGNSMKDNAGLGIDWGLDGVSPRRADDHEGTVNAPLLLSARYDPASDFTTVILVLDSRPAGPYYTVGYVEFFANDTPDGDGERLLTSMITHSVEGRFSYTIRGDWRGRWMNATLSREHQFFSRPGDVDTNAHNGGYLIRTSELSNSVLVE